MPKTALLFVTTALAEIVGCFVPYLWLLQVIERLEADVIGL